MRHLLAPPKAWFMIFRILAVVVWSVMTVTLATAFAWLQTGRIDWVNFVLVLMTAAIAQGYPAHIINEIFDWKSGADRVRKPGEKSGGSKVLQSGLATIPQLWFMFAASSTVCFALLAIVIARTDAGVLGFFFAGYFVCIFYTLPPLRFAYRPFAGEWLGGFAGIVLNMTGSFYVQTGFVSGRILWFAVATGLVYNALMMLFHYLDFENDRSARPVKNTTIVFLGLRHSRTYVLALLAAAAALFLGLAVTVHPLFWLLFANAAVHIFIQGRCDPTSDAAIIRAGKGLTYSVIIFSVAFASVIRPEFLFIAAFVIGCFLLHKRFGKLKPSAAH